MTNLSQKLTATAATSPDHIALIHDDLHLTYAQFECAAAKTAALLEQSGITPGDRVGLMLPNTPAFAILFYGILRAGAIAVPMNPLLKSREVAYYLTNTSAGALFAHPTCGQEAYAGADAADVTAVLVDDERLAALTADLAAQAAAVERHSDDTAVILHTSGTTGKPKGAQLTHGGLTRNADITASTLAQAGPDDVVMGCLPLFHVFGLTCALNTSVLVGSTLALMSRFDAQAALDIIARERVTIFEGVPTMYSALVTAQSAGTAPDTSSLRVCISGGAALPLQTISEFEAAFGAMILEGYGLSETSPVACFNHPDRPRRAGTIGTPIEGVQMRVIDTAGTAIGVDEPGEIQIRGHNVMKGYWNLPDATKAVIDSDGWFSTGDIGAVDADGYFRIVDRKKDIIIRAGFNVYPREVEEVLYEHPAVCDAAVLGVAHPTLGEEVAAAVELKEGAHADAAELRDYVKARVAAFKYPRLVVILQTLPKGPTGKIQKRDIILPATDFVPTSTG
jgi:long-chain acyl-CoA synthetase